MHDLVTLRLEVGSMKQAVLKAMSMHQRDIQTLVEQQAEQVCSIEYIQQVVRAEAEAALQACVKDAIRAAMVDLTYDTEIRNALREQLARALAPWLETLPPPWREA